MTLIAPAPAGSAAAGRPAAPPTSSPGSGTGADPGSRPDGRSVVRRLLRGRPADPAWVRPALIGLLGSAALLYLVGLGASGWANGFYSAAVQAGTRSWKAAFFGALDPSGFITVDKPPASLWVMDLSARLFGLSSWSILVPSALEGVACVGVLYATVRRAFPPGVALLGGALFTLTPVSALMFRFNDPDPLLTLLLLGATYAAVRAIQSERGWWLIAAAALVGTGFLAKMLQAMIVVPVLAPVYLWAGPGRIRARLLRLAAAGAVLVASAGWWVLAVSVVPAADRPYIGSSQDNSLVNLIFGYNGFGRLTGSEAGAVGFNPARGAGSGPAGWMRLVDPQFRTAIGWFLPAAVLLGAAALWAARRWPRRDPAKASLVLWAGTAAFTGATISLGRGVIHPYYSLALAPSVAALTAIGAGVLWARRDDRRVWAVLVSALGVTLVWAAWIVTGAAPWAGRAAAASVALGVAALLARRLRRPSAATAAIAVGLCLAGPTLYSVATAATPHRNAVPGVGAARSTRSLPAAERAAVLAADRTGGLLLAPQPGPAVVAEIRSASPGYRWAAATVGGERAAGYQLASGRPVMAIGGFNGTDPAPSLARFERYVRSGALRWFMVAGPPLWSGQPAAPLSDARAITEWVAARFPAQRVGPVTFYDLSR